MLNSEQANAFNDNGVVMIEQVISQSEVEALRTGINTLLNSPNKETIFRDNKLHPLYESANNVYRQAECFHDFCFNSNISKVAAEVLQSKTIRLYGDQLHIKMPGCETRTYWHQDATFFPLAGLQNCSAWIALDKVSHETGALEFIKGSHKSGRLYRPTTRLTAAKYPPLPIPDIPDIEAARDKYEIISFDMKPGDVVFFHLNTIHGATANHSLNQLRRGYVLRLLGDDMHFHIRDWQQAILTDKYEQDYPLLSK